MGLYIPWAAAFSGELSMPLRNTTTDLMDAVKEAKGIESDYGLAKLLAVELVAKSMETAVAAACIPAQIEAEGPAWSPTRAMRRRYAEDSGDDDTSAFSSPFRLSAMPGPG
jgi:hypothetical protein